MSHLQTAAAEVVEALRAAGIRVTEDPRSVNPPAVLVMPDVTIRNTTREVTVTLRVILIAPGPGNLDALRKLDVMADQVIPALDAAGLPIMGGRIVSMSHPATGEDLLTYDLNLEQPAEA